MPPLGAPAIATACRSRQVEAASSGIDGSAKRERTADSFANQFVNPITQPCTQEKEQNHRPYERLDPYHVSTQLPLLKSGEHGVDTPAELLWALFAAGRVLEAAELGLPAAQGEMAFRCHRGLGVEKDVVKCFQWATKAAAGGDIKGQFRLGYAHTKGEGGAEKDLTEALKWYVLASAQGCRSSMYNIGGIYEEGGSGVPMNNNVALVWFTMAASSGHASAAYKVGRHHYLAQDLVAARAWFETANARGDVDGTFMLGRMMLKGEVVATKGGPRGVEVAGHLAGLALVEAAAKKGSKHAAALLKRHREASAKAAGAAQYSAVK